MSTNQKFEISLLILGSICLFIWFLWIRLGHMIVHSFFGGIDLIVAFGDTMDSSMSIFFGFGVIIIIAACVFWLVENDPHLK